MMTSKRYIDLLRQYAAHRRRYGNSYGDVVNELIKRRVTLSS